MQRMEKLAVRITGHKVFIIGRWRTGIFQDIDDWQGPDIREVFDLRPALHLTEKLGSIRAEPLLAIYPRRRPVDDLAATS